MFSISGKGGGLEGEGREGWGNVRWNGGRCYWLGSERPGTQLWIAGQACKRRLYHTRTNGCNRFRKRGRRCGGRVHSDSDEP